VLEGGNPPNDLRVTETPVRVPNPLPAEIDVEIPLMTFGSLKPELMVIVTTLVALIVEIPLMTFGSLKR